MYKCSFLFFNAAFTVFLTYCMFHESASLYPSIVFAVTPLHCPALYPSYQVFEPLSL